MAEDKPTLIWSGGVNRKMGWYIVYKWTSNNEIYKHGPFNTFQEAKTYADKKNINL